MHTCAVFKALQKSVFVIKIIKFGFCVQVRTLILKKIKTQHIELSGGEIPPFFRIKEDHCICSVAGILHVAVPGFFFAWCITDVHSFPHIGKASCKKES